MRWLEPPPSPYRGIMPYGEEDAPFFFGREPERELIIANLMASRLTLLYGTSGVGQNRRIPPPMRAAARGMIVVPASSVAWMAHPSPGASAVRTIATWLCRPPGAFSSDS